MSCYHPKLMSYHGVNPETGKGIYLFEPWPAVKSQLPDNHIAIPCKKCIGCRLDYSRSWADRLVLELDHSKTALFLTLTYDDEHLTYGKFDDNFGRFWYSLNKKDLQDFNKRLRYYFRDREIRFYAAGEYGSQTLRPHIHGIYYGLSLSDFPDLQFLFFNKQHQPIYTSSFLEKIWQNGIVSIGNFSWHSAAYVARYNLKKLEAGYDDLPKSRGCLNEFSLMSRNPGIAGYFFDDHPEFLCDPTLKYYAKDPYSVRTVPGINLPSYLFEKLNDVNSPFTNTELYAKIKEDRKQASLDRLLKELDNTDLDEWDYMRLKEIRHVQSSKSLIRPLE